MREYFDKELTQLNDSLIEMGGLVEQAIKNTMKMIVDGEDLLDIARGPTLRESAIRQLILLKCLFTSRTKSRCSILLTFWKWQTMPQKW